LEPGFCLNLTDYGVASQIKSAYQFFRDTCLQAQQPLPENVARLHGISLSRKLDCAVINYLHALRQENDEPPFDTVYGVFEEGPSLFENSALKEKTHIQIAVCNNAVIRGYFRPHELCDYSLNEQ